MLRLLSAIDRKLVRDFWHMKGQMAAIISVIACGVATFVMSLTALEALRSTQAAYYDQYRFADVFANLKRAPATLIPRIAEIPGSLMFRPAWCGMSFSMSPNSPILPLAV